MKIKQQKQIKAFLIEEFGNKKGCAVSDRQEKMLDTLIQNTKNKSENQMKTLASTAKMELVPGFYAIYSNIFLKIMRTTDLQESTQAYGNDYYDVTIKKCLWHTACVENGCENLCRLFCDVDDVTYGGLKKIGFTRTKKLF